MIALWRQFFFLGLWSVSQGSPITKKWIFSVWLSDVKRLTGLVEWWVIDDRGCPPRVLTEIGWVSRTTGILSLWVRLMSIKFPSNPEYTKASQRWCVAAHCSLTGRRVTAREDFSKAVETSCLLTGLDFYETLSCNVSCSSTIETQSLSPTSLLLFPGKTSSAHLLGFRIEWGTDHIVGGDGRKILHSWNQAFLSAMISTLQPRTQSDSQINQAF